MIGPQTVSLDVLLTSKTNTPYIILSSGNEAMHTSSSTEHNQGTYLGIFPSI